ncbi:bloodthirsty-related gene family, member 29 [Danio rerio]|uniref:Bloodthirsty-related gene family, member 29 n=2 Tax=Danio rerio TaxID=7955 RepID=A0A8M1NTY9_DANRE|nr:bloodthirsty-related gene family, member 29 [Danio rerio]XP_021323821.1 bloodthirsty-related gene family, member 29 isoform X1 [Danio rerio]|eukprot:NP_001159606.1 bloodthirsty-related gene family, member 29 [Danio rerio]
MSSSGGPLSVELSVCLDVFTDPVSTPCGHNLSKNSQICQYTKETLNQRPDLKINTTLREISDHYKLKSPDEGAVVVCDLCEDRTAVKSCLVCQSSYCETHLQPHLKVTGLKKHKLMHPVSNLEDYICQTHQRPLELFCRDDHMSVCLHCAVTDHKTHNTVLLEDENQKMKAQLMETQRDLQKRIQDRFKEIQDIEQSAEARRRVYTDLLKLMEDQQRAAEEQDSERMSALEQEISELESRNTELEQLSHTEDHLHLIQIHSSLSSFRNTRSRSEISRKTRETLKRALIKLKESIDEKLEQTVSADLKWMQQYAVDVTLDPHTAHPELILSDDGKQVSCGDIWQKLPNKLERFNRYLSVLGREGFSSGRFYFEVLVKGKTDWTLGVARESVDRKGDIRVSPETGSWTVALINGNELSARADPPVLLSLRVSPQRVGVFVDYEEGLVCFYDVESSSHIYSYTDQCFSEKLHPCFSPGFNFEGKNSTPLIITHLSYNH